MPAVFPFRAVQYTQKPGGSSALSALVAPPYDVLDGAAKAALLAKDPRNVVGIDLPHIPAKELGPPAAYSGAAATYRGWLADGTMRRADRAAMFAYRQTFTTSGRTVRRTGMACTVEAASFGARAGGGILPHEETFSGPKEDRLALMRATAAQMSPIFGLHQDEQGRANAIVQRVTGSRAADFTATLSDGVLHEVWVIEDEPTIAAYRDALAGEDIFIADGHHRYTTQINYIKELEVMGKVGPDHPARRCMMVLIGMSDPGLVIWPTHRVLGGMKDYTIDKFIAAAAKGLLFEPVAGDLSALGAAVEKSVGLGKLGLYDFATRRCMLVRPISDDPLAGRFPAKPRAWRTLDVAVVQYAIVEEICQSKMNGGQPVKWAFPHTIEEVAAIGRGAETGAGGGAGFAQLAVIVKPTPLSAVREVSRAGELMPQKSTFFYPKLATGFFINPLE